MYNLESNVHLLINGVVCLICKSACSINDCDNDFSVTVVAIAKVLNSKTMYINDICNHKISNLYVNDKHVHWKVRKQLYMSILRCTKDVGNRRYEDV